VVDRGWLGHHERQREGAEAGRRRPRAAYPEASAQAERGGVELVGGRGVGDLQGDGIDGRHGRSLRCGSHRPGVLSHCWTLTMMVSSYHGIRQSLYPSSVCAKLEQMTASMSTDVEVAEFAGQLFFRLWRATH